MRKHVLNLTSLGAVVGLLVLALNGTAAAQVAAVPEIDPSTAAGGLAILGAAGLLLIERFRRR